MASYDGLPQLARVRALPGGGEWVRSLPERVAACCDRWRLTVGEPYAGSSVSLVLPAWRSDGEAAVVKLQFPHRESEHEAAALARWSGNGAVRLLDEAPDVDALLLERCVPGTPLSELPLEEALDVLVDLIGRLSIPADEEFTALADEARWWASYLPTRWERAGRPFDVRLVDHAVASIERLSTTQGPQVLVHQDLHGDNVLRAEREPWLTIDPKPLAAEREFAAAPVIRSYEFGHSRDAVLTRFRRLVDGLGLDPVRTRDWAIAQTVAWAFEGDAVLPRHIDTATWLLAA